jgi:hypothetical protein
MHVHIHRIVPEPQRVPAGASQAYDLLVLVYSTLCYRVLSQHKSSHLCSTPSSDGSSYSFMPIRNLGVLGHFGSIMRGGHLRRGRLRKGSLHAIFWGNWYGFRHQHVLHLQMTTTLFLNMH